jgi:NADPH-dependent glutamate synthase beta subunit-like oxidoreductase/NAD(P)H-flavin reductase
MRLGITGFNYEDLYEPRRLAALSDAFWKEVELSDPPLFEEFAEYRQSGGGKDDSAFPPVRVSRVLISVAQHLSRFLARLFLVQSEAAVLSAATRRDSVIFEFKKSFVQRRVRKLDAATVLEAVNNFAQLDASVANLKHRIDPTLGTDDELEIAQTWKTLSNDKDALRILEAWVAALGVIAPGRISRWVSWRQPQTLDYSNLVQIDRPRADLPELAAGPEFKLRRRDGFKLTDPRMDKRQALDEVHYCIYCHERDKDSCSKGFVESDHHYRTNPLGIELAGCPLEERISEAHLLRRDGDVLAALAVIMIDNPLCPGTGHRICNDCMKSCIFQKQEPVNIPQIETRILTEVLSMPYGVEIYGLLTRWNPLNIERPHALEYNGRNVLVVGLGPAGYTLAHYLLNEGFGVAGIDGLKIEPLPERLTGTSERAPEPVRDWNEIRKELDERVLEGFGGVSEYGITVRWDKNFLTLLHLTLARRRHLRMFGGVRFGGTLTLEDCWAFGFDHVAIATGAGRPTVVRMKNNMIRGVRMASDFLMALQLTGAFKESAMANLQVDLPAVVIGGGLTAIDTATELAAYYPVQVEKVLKRYESLVAAYGKERVENKFDAEDREAIERWLEHGRKVRAERERASASGRKPNLVDLVRSWGGVSIVYRKSLQDSPAYRLNHEEVIKSLEEGISFVERLDPVGATADGCGKLAGITFERQVRNESGGWKASGEMVELPARTACIAAGTSPNTTYEKEWPGTFKLDGRQQFFQPFRLVDEHLDLAGQDGEGFFTSYDLEGKYVTYYGDNHPAFAGNVVKAMASARFGYREIVRLFDREIAALDPSDQPERESAFRSLASTLDDQLRARVVRVDRLTPTIVEIIVRAPLAARKFHPGQFYRLQNYEVNAAVVRGTKLTMEGIALTGAWTDPEEGLLSLIVLEMGASSRLCAQLKAGEEVIVMGPTGAPTEIPANETVLLAGGGLGNAVLFSIARALKAKGNRVIYFAGYKKRQDIFKREEIEASTDQVIWSVEFGEMIEPFRPQDHCFTGNIVQAMKAYADGQFGAPLFRFCDVDRLIAIGSDRMMGAVKVARRNGSLAGYFREGHAAIGSINSPMQCMMKEVCAQCLQRHVDPETGAEAGFVFSCFNQDQPLDAVDFAALSGRLRANSAQEKLADLWFEYLLV